MRRRREEDPNINLTPMIDVVFLLLIFFLAGSSFNQGDDGIRVDVPGVGNLNPVARGADPRKIIVDRQGAISLDGRPTSLQVLSQELQQATQAYPGVEVVIQADTQGAVQGIAEVLKTARASGVRNPKLTFATTRY